jgi:alpha-L-rhamnosidase
MQADIRHAVNWKWALFPLAMLLAVGALLASGRPFSPVAEHSEHAQPARTAFGSGARWIWNATDTPDQWVAFRRTFILRAAPSSALTHISVDTHYWLYVNGNLVIFEGGLKRGPNRTDTYYDQKDIASHLSSGPNTIAILAWHFGRNGGAAASHTHVDSGSGALLFRSDILVNGVTTTINSDINWKQTIFPGYVHDTSAPMPYILPEWNIHYDARNAGSMTNWTTSGYDDSAWFPPVEKGGPGAAPWNALVLRPIPLYRFTGLRSYANNSSLPTSGNGSNITAKLPSNVQVTPYLRVNAPAGLTITIQTDHYNDGGQTNVRSTYITTSGEQEFESLGWMSGTAVIYNIPTGVTVLDLKYRESGYDTAFAGSFTSNDPFFNSLWTKAVRTMYVNMRDNYSDCPTRERALWWGDAAVAVRGSVYAFDRRVNLLANKGIKQLVGWKRPNGVLFSPIPGDSRELPPQMLATIAEMWDFYLQTGDSSALDGTTYTAVKTYMNLWTFDSHGLVNHRPGDWDWYDWGSNIDARVLDNAWYYMALDSTINLAKLTGNGQDVAGWQSKKNSIAANFNDALWNNTNHEYRSPGYTGGTDDRANAMAVVSGLASAANYSHITNVLRTHQNPSPYMETFVIEALYRMNAATDAQNRLASRYKAMVDDPAYTLWEVWEKGAGTDDHGWNGAPLMLSRYGIGARATSPGWTTYELLPQRGKLTTMNGVIPTVKGTLSVSLNASNTTSYTLGITSPNGTTGRVGVPTLATNITITANGTTVFQNGAATGSVSGLSYQGNDANYVYFNVNPGIWNFAATGGLVTASPAPALAPGWNYCAGEGGTCVFSDTTQVRYGSGTTFNTLTLTGGTPCTNAVFGDTTPGVVKHCDLYVSAVGVISYQDINYSGTASDANGPHD